MSSIPARAMPHAKRKAHDEHGETTEDTGQAGKRSDGGKRGRPSGVMIAAGAALAVGAAAIAAVPLWRSRHPEKGKTKRATRRAKKKAS